VGIRPRPVGRGGDVPRAPYVGAPQSSDRLLLPDAQLCPGSAGAAAAGCAEIGVVSESEGACISDRRAPGNHRTTRPRARGSLPPVARDAASRQAGNADRNGGYAGPAAPPRSDGPVARVHAGRETGGSPRCGDLRGRGALVHGPRAEGHDGSEADVAGPRHAAKRRCTSRGEHQTGLGRPARPRPRRNAHHARHRGHESVRR